MRIVLDTNVLVSGLLSPFGPPGEIVRMVSSGSIVLCLDARLLSEYEAVLSRPKFGFPADEVAAFIDYVDFRGETVAANPLTSRLPDPGDEPFLEVAVTCAADCLITGNAKHFPHEAYDGVPILSPAQFIERYRSALSEDSD